MIKLEEQIARIKELNNQLNEAPAGGTTPSAPAATTAPATDASAIDAEASKKAPLNVKKENNYFNINGHRYKLQVYKFILGGWTDVNVDDIKMTPKGIQVTASVSKLSQTDIVPPNTVNWIMKNLGQKVIELANESGDVVKKLIKI